MYSEAKAEFDGQNWNVALQKFEDIMHEGHGEGWRHTEKVLG